MHLFFLIPFCTGLITSYFTRTVDDEITYLANVITLVSFAISLIIAPWQIQLLILVILLINIQRFFPKNQQEIEQPKIENTQLNQVKLPENSQENRTIKYRGVTYNLYSTETSITEGEIVGRYRGNVLHSHKLTENSIEKKEPNPKYSLKYRGVRVNSNSKSKNPQQS